MEIIEKIKKAQKIEDVLSVDNLKSDFETIIKQIHPDVCNDPQAAAMSAKITAWKKDYEKGKEYTDDLGPFKTNGYWADFKSDSAALNWSVENYRHFCHLQSSADAHFLKYLPMDCKQMEDGTFRFIFEKRAIPLSGLTLPQEHVNWVLNRLLEYCAYLSQTGFVHGGLNPESVFIVPETHGIQICSFYHLSKLHSKMGTISGRYRHWYPSEIFRTKIATPVIDIELSKKIAAYLLGDRSGSAVKLRKTHDEKFINFLLTRHTNAYSCLESYKDFLRKNFEKKFHSLTI